MTLDEAIKIRDRLNAEQAELRAKLLRVNLEKMVNAMRLSQLIHGKPVDTAADTYAKWERYYRASPNRG